MDKLASLMEVLVARDRRAQRQSELIDQYHKPIISFTMNIAGPVKNNPDIKRGYELGKQMLKRELQLAEIRCLHFEEISESTGNEAFHVLDAEPIEIKRVTTEIEDMTPLGRLFDLDVIDTQKRKIDRKKVGLDGRKCLICGNDAKECARSRTHSVEELQKRTSEILRETFEKEDAERAAELACKALLYEVCTTPKPGLVDCQNNGSHKDMDVFTFINSACALRPYFERCVRIGRQSEHLPAKSTFEQIRQEGMRAEYAMFASTDGVNTHKGAIFSMGILCAALGRLSREEWKQPELILNECANMAEGIVEKDFKNLSKENAVTNGQKLYVNYGITGIRGQVEEGFPAVRNIGLPILRKGLQEGRSLNESGGAALLAIMTESIDTNLIARSDICTQRQVVDEVRSLLEENPYPSIEQLNELDQKFIRKNLSPGGSADLLAICYLLYFLEND